MNTVAESTGKSEVVVAKIQVAALRIALDVAAAKAISVTDEIIE